MKNIKFVIINIFRIIIKLLLVFDKRNNNIFLFGNYPKPIGKNKRKEQFLHNTKYFFLYISNYTNIKAIYLCDDKNMRKYFHDRGYSNVYSRYSFKGLYYTLRAKYWFTDYDASAVANTLLLGNAYLINLWHGIPLKKIVFDNVSNKQSLKMKIYYLLRLKNIFFIINSFLEQQHFKEAFCLSLPHFIQLGSPKNDIITTHIKDADMLMENDFENIKSLHEQGKKIIIYMPTFRDTGKNVSNWLNSKNLRNILRKNNIVILCKLHPADENSIDLNSGVEYYKMKSNSDVYPILKYTDAMITDYSSINYDYLLLNKPIIYYVPDLEEYQEKCRGFYTPYSDFAVGTICTNEVEIINAIKDVNNNIDNHKNERKELCNKMFKFQDGHNCERVIEWVKSLDRKGNKF